MNRARTLGNERSLALGLFLACDLLGASLPEDVSARIQIDPKVRLVAARVDGIITDDPAALIAFLKQR